VDLPCSGDSNAEILTGGYDMATVYLDPTADVKELATMAFPSYRGRTFKLVADGDPVSVVSYWAGGSRDSYVAIDLATGRALPIPQNGTPFDGGPIRPDGVAVPPGYAIVKHSVFCGKDVGITFYVHPSAAARFLPAPVDITDDARLVLNYTAQLVISCGGETNIRFREAARDKGITRQQWDDAQQALKTRGMLNKAGAITNAGRNAIARR